MPGIGYVFQDHYPWDVRVEKIVNSLADAGYPTVVISRNRTGDPVRESVREGLEIRRLPRAWGASVRAVLNFPAFFSPVWIGAMIRAVRRVPLDLLIVRDLPLAPAAYWAGRLAGVPVIMDMAEDYPAMIADTWKYRGPRAFDFLLRNPKLLRRLERWIVPKLDGVIVVSKASGERVMRLLNGKGCPVWVVGNTPKLGGLSNPAESEHSQRIGRLQGLKVLYTGGLEEARGLEVVIRALPLVREKIGEATLVIVGDSTSAGALKVTAERLGVSSSVTFTGWLEPRHVPGVIREADVCLVPHYVSDHTNTTIPNKIFEYMLQAKPVVVTHSKSLRAIVEEYGCGCVYQDDRPADLARAVCSLTDPEIREQMGRRGQKAISDAMNWSADESTLLKAVRDAIGRGGQKR